MHPGEDGIIDVIKPLRLGNGDECGYNAADGADDFFQAGLFKKVALGEFGIRATITDTDMDNPFTVFVRKVLSKVFSAALGPPINSIENVLVSNAASVLSSNLGAAMNRRQEEKPTVIGVSPLAKFRVEKNGTLNLTNKGNGLQYNENMLTLPLHFPLLVKTGSNTYGMPGAANGQVVIRLHSEPINSEPINLG